MRDVLQMKPLPRVIFTIVAGWVHRAGRRGLARQARRSPDQMVRSLVTTAEVPLRNALKPKLCLLISDREWIPGISHLPPMFLDPQYERERTTTNCLTNSPTCCSQSWRALSWRIVGGGEFPPGSYVRWTNEVNEGNVNVFPSRFTGIDTQPDCRCKC